MPELRQFANFNQLKETRELEKMQEDDRDACVRSLYCLCFRPFFPTDVICVFLHTRFIFNFINLFSISGALMQ